MPLAELPEWSHITGEEADRFTEAFYGLVQRELARFKRTQELTNPVVADHDP